MEYRLPEALLGAMRAEAPTLRGPYAGAERVESLVSMLDALPPSAVARADHEAAWALGLHAFQPSRPAWWRIWSQPRDADLAVLAGNPNMAHLFLFHRDGHLREAALNAMHGPARSPFFFAMIAMRLNDWAAPVRRAAIRCAERVFPLTPPEAVSRAAVFLLKQRQQWRRWTAIETGPLDAALARPDVAEALVDMICTSREGLTGALLRSALRAAGFDRWLTRFATDAALPDVRRIALQALIERRFRWPSHREKKWVDKSMGRYREAWALGSRPIESPMTVERAVWLAAHDKSAAVRRLAVIALLTRHRELTNFEEIATLLANDRKPALRERTAFALTMDAPDTKTGAASLS